MNMGAAGKKPASKHVRFLVIAIAMLALSCLRVDRRRLNGRGDFRAL